MEGNCKLELKIFGEMIFLFQVDERVGKDVWELSCISYVFLGMYVLWFCLWEKVIRTTK
jgi:hypothetical protein